MSDRGQAGVDGARVWIPYMSAVDALLTLGAVRNALGDQVRLQPGAQNQAVQSIGSIIAAAASDAAYRSFAGQLVLASVERPVAVGQMVLVFESEEKAERTFTTVADAAHLRARLQDCQVAVETSATSGLVSYWGYIFRGRTLVVLTLDTLDPQVLSMTSFRSLVSEAAERLVSAQR
jgi:hypothetical protein